MQANIEEEIGSQENQNPVFITAQNLIIEVIDESDGRMYRRELPLQYKENRNGIVLQGENSKGEAVEIVFLSEQALIQIHELTGHGSDQPRCHDHD